MEAYLANGNVCADVIQTTQEALRHPQLQATGNLVVLDDPRVGRVLQIGPIAKISGAPASVQRPAPVPGEHTDEVLGEDAHACVRALAGTGRTLRGPLDGITIVEAGYYYATPFATALLAELGARVIKVEPIAGDPYRLLGRGRRRPCHRPRAQQHGAGHAGQGVDRSEPEGPSGPRGRPSARWSGPTCSSTASAATCPRHSGSTPRASARSTHGSCTSTPTSYGSTGPYARQPAIDPVVAAFAGQTAHQTGEGNPPLRESGADPVAAAGHALAMMLGLFAAHRTGEGQDVESSMIVSNMYLNYEDALVVRRQAASSRSSTSRQFGTGPTHRLYECAAGSPRRRSPTGTPIPAGSWWSPMTMLPSPGCSSVVGSGDLGSRRRGSPPQRFASSTAPPSKRSCPRPSCARTAQEWEQRLLDAGVGCTVADAASHFAFLLRGSSGDGRRR